MDEDSGSYNKNYKPHNISTDDRISIINRMDDPAYIVLQDNGRYVEVVSYRGEKKKNISWAVLDFNQNKNEVLLNGYPDKQRFYVHEVWAQEENQNKQRAHHSLVSEEISDLNQASSTAYVNSILDSLRKYKGQRYINSL